MGQKSDCLKSDCFKTFVTRVYDHTEGVSCIRFVISSSKEEADCLGAPTGKLAISRWPVRAVLCNVSLECTLVAWLAAGATIAASTECDLVICAAAPLSTPDIAFSLCVSHSVQKLENYRSDIDVMWLGNGINQCYGEPYIEVIIDYI